MTRIDKIKEILMNTPISIRQVGLERGGILPRECEELAEKIDSALPSEGLIPLDEERMAEELYKLETTDKRKPWGELWKKEQDFYRQNVSTICRGMDTPQTPSLTKELEGDVKRIIEEHTFIDVETLLERFEEDEDKEIQRRREFAGKLAHAIIERIKIGEEK